MLNRDEAWFVPDPADLQDAGGGNRVAKKRGHGELSPDRQRIITEEVNRMLAERAVEGPERA
jgi:hypothetical protein